MYFALLVSFVFLTFVSGRSDDSYCSSESQESASNENDDDCDLDSNSYEYHHRHHRRHRSQCPDGYKKFKRETYYWCIKVAMEGKFIQEDAEQRCRNEGAVLSGVENEEERDYIAETARELLPYEGGVLWLGAKRREPCLHVGITAECTADTSFEWTDGNTNGSFGYLWNIGVKQPDNAYRSQLCVDMLILRDSDEYLHKGKHQYYHGHIDDISCVFPTKQLPNGPVKSIVGYVCGRKAN